ncbi:YbaB/EbfC family nucleoid-associated protein [Nonomuraea sp. NPDC049784]|uniref:YbaB/EbfC family nucleoid-associated protein n=1 Tax=Nonomuraea sp. NPDC049784 TaxID=3154361 RepID=UPI00340E9E07
MLLDPGGISPEDLERVAREADEALRRLAGLQERINSIRGTGTGADGMIVVGADSSGRIDSIQLNPRVMRLASQDLAGELLRAVSGAQDDCARQTHDLIAEAGVSTSVDPAAYEAMERQVNDAHAAFIREMERFSPGHGQG